MLGGTASLIGTRPICANSFFCPYAVKKQAIIMEVENDEKIKIS